MSHKEYHHRPNTKDKFGNQQRWITCEIAGVEPGRCLKCGDDHKMRDIECRLFKEDLAPQKCSNCNRGCHYQEDCPTQVKSQLKEKEKLWETRRRIQTELTELKESQKIILQKLDTGNNEEAAKETKEEQEREEKWESEDPKAGNQEDQ